MISGSWRNKGKENEKSPRIYRKSKYNFSKPWETAKAMLKEML
jgi:hypothetical protein